MRLGPQGFRRMVREGAVEAVAVHSRAWRRQVCPQVFTVALAVAPVARRFIFDEEADGPAAFGASDAAWSLARAPADVVGGVAVSSYEVGRHMVKARRPVEIPEFAEDPRPPNAWILVIWRSHDAVVGGSVTHVTGILRGFRNAGFKIALLTTSEPVPEQVLSAVDALKRAPPLPPSERLTTEIERLGINRQLRSLGIRWCRDLRPRFIYQRHALLLDAGPDIAAACHVPLILEWNASEVWARGSWGSLSTFGRVLTPITRPLRESMERRAVTCATLVLAVSRHAAAMAYKAGATAARVLHVPNGVDVDEVLPASTSYAGKDSLLIGWIGTFGSWHGAPIIVEALALLPPEFELVMIGDGAERQACGALAESLGIDHRIDWAGTLPHQAALERLRGCDVLVSPHVPLPSTPFFGSPTKIYEYMALGRPIVASRLEQLEEVLEDGRTGRLVTPGDVKELAQAIQEVLRGPERGRQLGVEARREAEAKHSWDRRVQFVLGHIGDRAGASR